MRLCLTNNWLTSLYNVKYNIYNIFGGWTYFVLSVSWYLGHSLNSNILLDGVYWTDLNDNTTGMKTFWYWHPWVRQITSLLLQMNNLWSGDRNEKGEIRNLQVFIASLDVMPPKRIMWCDQAKWVLNWSNSIFVFLIGCIGQHHLQTT